MMTQAPCACVRVRAGGHVHVRLGGGENCCSIASAGGLQRKVKAKFRWRVPWALKIFIASILAWTVMRWNW